MRYERRWRYVLSIVISVLFLSFIVDFKFLLQKINHSNEIHANQLVELKAFKLHSDSIDMKAINSKNKKQKLHPVLLEELMPMLQANQLELRSLENQGSQSNHGVEMDAVRLTVTGRFVDVERLLVAMSAGLHNGVMLNFSLKANSSINILCSMDLLLWQGLAVTPAAKHKIVKISNKNPMCLTKDDLVTVNANELLQRISLAQMQMIGYIQADSQSKALILLNGVSLAEVTRNMLIGKERARVIDITEDSVLLQVGNKKQQLTRTDSYDDEEDNA